MQFKLFTVPTGDDGSALEELNRFLRSARVLEVEQQLLSARNGSQWHFCVKYLANASAESGGTMRSGGPRVDYKEVLDEKTFAVFSVLREARKKISEEEGIPIYAVFTNEELAAMAALSDISIASLRTVKGVGEKKAERFGKRLLELYAATNSKIEEATV
ncbi:MAG: HRDC domain-containing protein [Bacteroidales bacterium]|jgi:superfamily II DNA helicase RecQ|nr:HRDC domain-containing protein [Bacteroidales bacterium]